MNTRNSVLRNVPIRWLCFLSVIFWGASLFAQGEKDNWYYVQPGTLPPKDAKIVRGPTVTKQADGQYAISFEVDKPTDVAVRIVDAEGKTVRHLAAGVVGLTDAPEPFAAARLAQAVRWDGKDNTGKPVTVKGLSARIDVCVQAKLDRFLAWQPGACKGVVYGLDVDREGNLSVWNTQTTPLRDMFFLYTYDRDGKYLRTVVPYRPDVSLERQRACFTQVAQRGIIPFAKIPTGKIVPNACLPVSGNEKTNSIHGYTLTSAGIYGKPFGWFTDGRYLISPWMYFVNSSYQAMGPDGLYYVPMRIIKEQPWDMLNAFVDADDMIHLVPEHGAGKRQQGHAVYKFDGKTLEPATDFSFSGKEKLDQPRYHLGEPGVAGDDDKHLNNPSDVAVDRQGNVLVAQKDGIMKRFRRDGFYLDKWSLPFEEIRAVSCGKFPPTEDTVYVLGTNPADGRKQIVSLVKFRPSTGKVVWQLALPGATVLSIRGGMTVDTSRTPAVIWLAGGDGIGSFSRIEDAGEKAGDIRHLHPSRENVVLQPYNICVDVDADVLFVTDINRGFAVRIRASDGGGWAELPETSYPTYGHNATMAIDRRRRRLYFDHFRNRDQAPKCLSYEGKVLEFPAINKGTVAVDAEGNVYVCRTLSTFKHIPREDWSEANKKANIHEDPKTVFTYLAQNVLTDDERLGPSHLCWVRGTRWEDDKYGAYFRWSSIEKYDAQGTLVRRDYARPLSAAAGIDVDGRGFAYAMDTTNYDVHGYELGKYRRYPRDSNHLIRYAPGGIHGGEGEEWRRRGVSPVLGIICGCGPKGQVNIDEFDRVFVTDGICHNIKVFDTAGNLISVIGSYGNEDCAGPDSPCPDPEIGLCIPAGVDATKDWCFIADTNNGRIVKCRLVYGDSVTRSIEQDSRALSPPKSPSGSVRPPVE